MGFGDPQRQPHHASCSSASSIAGYANYGRNRARSLFYDGEIYELYLRPEFQGLGFGRRLFTAARKDLVQSGLKSLVVWALSDNEPALEFYRRLGRPCGGPFLRALRQPRRSIRSPTPGRAERCLRKI